MDPRDDQYVKPMPVIPLVEVGAAGPVVVAEAEPVRLAQIVDAAERHYGNAVIAIADRLSEYWLGRNGNPYLEEIQMVADHVGRAGAFMLNMSFEWSCTAGVWPDPSGKGNRLLRTLDWPLDELGRNVVVARFEGEEGSYDSVTWPGFAGVATALAQGRFSAAINQPPMRRWSPSCWLDWGVNRIRMFREDALPPAHLLRQVFDQCRTYIEARNILSDTPLAMPALFSLSGLEPDQCCIIERTEDEVCVHHGPGAVANHWLRLATPGRSRGIDSTGRLDQMLALQPDVGDDFSWVRAPILNSTTRISVIANAATGRLKVLGWEDDPDNGITPATLIYDGVASRKKGTFRPR